MIRPSDRTPSTSMITIRMSLHFFRSPGDGPRLDRKLFLYDMIERHNRAKKPLEPVEPELAGSIAEGPAGVGGCFHEEPVDADRDTGPRNWKDELRPSPRAVAAPRKLNRMRGIEDHRVSEFPHDAQRSHVHDQVVVAECRPALGQQDVLIPGRRHFCGLVAHVLRSHELPLLDVYRLSGAAGRPQEVGLPAEERGNLEDVGNFSGCCSLLHGMNIGENRDAELLPDFGENRQGFTVLDPGEGGSARPVRLLVRCLENEGGPEFSGDALNALGSPERLFTSFDDAWTRDEDDREAAADFNLAYAVHFGAKYKNPEEFQRRRIGRGPIASLVASPYVQCMLTVRAYAKINLGLRILGRRKDGYHDIETVFHRIDLFDEVSLAPADGLTLECFPESLPSDERNLCYQAAQLLSRRLHRSPGASIVLRKAIPEGAGLGGGSSDAAATLLGLVQLWDADLPAGELRDLALRLGSDVPYFLNDGSAS